MVCRTIGARCGLVWSAATAVKLHLLSAWLSVEWEGCRVCMQTFAYVLPRCVSACSIVSKAAHGVFELCCVPVRVWVAGWLVCRCGTLRLLPRAPSCSVWVLSSRSSSCQHSQDQCA